MSHKILIPKLKPKPNNPLNPSLRKKKKKRRSTRSETESESKSDGVSKFKPLATKPVEQTQKASNVAISKPTTPETKSATAKHHAEDTAAHQDAKKLMMTATDEPEETKFNLFKRVWSEKNELAILQRMIDYDSKEKGDPISDLSAFLDFIKPSLDLDVSRSHLQDKLRRLKKKYRNNKRKEKDGKK